MKQLAISNQQLSIARRGFIFTHSGKRTLKGFTLVELLVVIAIIGILAAVVMIAINPLEMMRKGRDSTRLQDMENVRKAIDMSVASGSDWASTTPPVGTTYRSNDMAEPRICGATNGWVRGIDVCMYLSSLPIDPRVSPNSSDWHYEFVYDSNGNYEIRCHLESTENQTKYYTSDGGDDDTWYEMGTDPGLDLL